jgi:hypothetical protein
VGVDTHGDVGRLLVDEIVDLGVLPVKAVLFVADFLDRVARHVLDQRGRHFGRSTHLAG